MCVGVGVGVCVCVCVCERERERENVFAKTFHEEVNSQLKKFVNSEGK